MEHGAWLKDFMVFLIGAGIIVPIFHRARIGAVLGFLLVGILVGRYGLGQFVGEHPWLRYLTIDDKSLIELFGELGVMFLLFLVGLELSVTRLWAMRRFVLGIGGAQFVLSALALGGGALLAGIDAKTAIVIGLCFAMSSTAIVMQLLEEQGRAATTFGQVAIAILLFQDLMVAPVLFGIDVLARGGSHLFLDFAAALLQAAGAVITIAIVGRFVLRPVFRFAAQTGSRELIMAITLLIILGTAAATSAAGLSTALGAFIAGLLLSETEYRHQVEVDLAPFKGLLVGLFFVSVGMIFDVGTVWANPALVGALVAALIVAKGVVLYLACRMFGIAIPVAAEIAILLPQTGEFAFIVVTVANRLQLIPDDTAQVATATAVISMVLTPLCAVIGRRFGNRLQRFNHRHDIAADGAADLSDHVVIGGFGRAGQTVARLLQAENIAFIGLDTNGELVTEQRKQGHPVYFGDAGRVEFLDRAGAARARAFVVTINAREATERMVAIARRTRPEAPVFARATDPAHAARLIKLGAVGVIPEEVEASLQLGARLLEALGMPDEAIERRIDVLRGEEIGRLGAAGPAGARAESGKDA